jgi:outer membrane immunogenic protein
MAARGYGVVGIAPAAAVAPAAAADLSIAPIYKAPPPAPVTAWVAPTGVVRWRRLGKAVVRNDSGADRTRTDLGGGIVDDLGQIRPIYGARPEADISATNKKGSAAEFPPNAIFNNEVKERWLSTFRGRVGYAQDNWLLYATGGAALANVENTVASAPGGQISDKQWHWGWTAGGGVEVKLTQDWTAKVEYLYVGLQDKSYFNPAPSLVFPSSQRLNLNDHIVRVGVNYKLPWNVLDGFFKR